MAQTIFGTDYAVAALNRAFNNTSPANAVFQSQKSSAGTTPEQNYAFARQFGSQFNNISNADLAKQVMTNMGALPSTDADVLAFEGALTDYFATVAIADRGIVVLQLSQLLSGLETATGAQAVYADTAKAWNKEVERAYVYSSDPSHTTPQEGDDGSGTTTLTRQTDVLTGSTFTGYLDYNQYTGTDEQTLTTGDRLTGTDGDSDMLFAQQTVGSRPTLNGIEIVSIDAKGTIPTLDLSDSNGIKQVVNFQSSETSTLTFQGLKNLVDVVVDHTNANTVVTFNGSVVAGANDQLNLMVKGAGVASKASDFTANGIENLVITASEDASVLGTVTDAQLRKLTIKGDQNLNVGTKAGGGFTSTVLDNVDATEATGNIFLNVSAGGATNQTIKTGDGNDTIVVSSLTANDNFDLGGGTNRVVLANGDTGTNQAAKLTNVQQIEVRTVNTNLNLVNAADVNLIAIGDVANATALPPVVAASISNVTAVKSGTTFAFEGNRQVTNKEFGGVNYNLASATGTDDVINVTFSNGGTQVGTDGTVTIGNIVNTGNNVETVNLTFSDVGADDIVTVNDVRVGTALRTLNVTSDSKVTLGGTTGGAQDLTDLTGLTSVDASGVKGAFTAVFSNGAGNGLAANANATVKTGGAGNNAVTVGKAVDAGAAGAASGHTTLTVDASAGTGAQAFTVNNQDADINAAGNASFVFLGGTGGDTLILTSVAGSLNSITGGKGADTLNLTSSAGADHLVYNVGDSLLSSSDQVQGFNADGAAANADKIDLRAFGFDVALQGVNTTGQLTGQANEFVVGGTQRAVAVWATSATSATVYIDVNGDAKLDANDLVINLTGLTGANAAALAASEFLFA